MYHASRSMGRLCEPLQVTVMVPGECWFVATLCEVINSSKWHGKASEKVLYSLSCLRASKRLRCRQ